MYSTGYNNRKDPLILFYDNPEQCENHWFRIIDKETKDKWFQKYKETILILENERKNQKIKGT